MPPSKHSLNILLHSIEDRPGKYHWAFYIPDSRMTEVGDVYHCTNFNGLAPWAYSKIPATRILFEKSTILAFEIGVIPDGFGPFTLNRRRFEKVVTGVPVGSAVLVGEPPEELTSRTWVQECVRRLVKEGMLLCGDVSALEDEAREAGHEASLKGSGEGRVGMYELAVSTVGK
ncbi:hypothetical protein EV426DRAFT_573703 [Tirmania nivea]|nr:hypothetical protein EV426DRAFT_573703 [Tirmania nivea]